MAGTRVLGHAVCPLAQLAAALLLAGCAPKPQYYTWGADAKQFARYRTYAIAGVKETPKAYRRTPLSPELREVALTAAREKLAELGYVATNSSQADLLFYAGVGRMTGQVAGAHERFVEDGTLVVSAVDRRSSAQVWSGQIVSVVRPQLHKGRLRQAVQELMSRFPTHAGHR